MLIPYCVGYSDHIFLVVFDFFLLQTVRTRSRVVKDVETEILDGAHTKGWA